MAQTRNYLNHLLQSTGITPACSMEERAAADEIAKTFASHGFTPEMQEFSASGSPAIVAAVLGMLVFLSAVLAGFGGALGIAGMLLLVGSAVLFVLERADKPVLSRLGTGGLSQNVIAHHEATGPMASPRNRPVVVVAHYDSPRADVFAQMPYATYRPLIMRILPIAMVAPAAMMILRFLPLPATAKLILWILAILMAVVPLIRAIATILNRFALPYTSGAVCNKSSVAALLGIMDDVAPYKGKREFQDDVPFERYIADQRRLADQERLAEEPARTSGDVGAPGGGAHAARRRGSHGASGAAPRDEPETSSSLPIEETTEAAPGVERESTLTMEPLEIPTPEGSSAPLSEGAPDSEPARGTASSPEAQITDAPAATEELISSPAEMSSDGAQECQIATEAPASRPASAAATNAGARVGVGAGSASRHGAAIIRSLRMVPASCELIYDEDPAEAPAPTEKIRSQGTSGGATEGDSTPPADTDRIDAHAAVFERRTLESERDSAPEGDHETSIPVESIGRDSYIADDDDFAYEDEYDDDQRPSASQVERPTGHATLAEALSGVGAEAARILDATIRKGRDLLGGATVPHTDARETAPAESDPSETPSEFSEPLACEDPEPSVAADAAERRLDPDLGATVPQESLAPVPPASDQQTGAQEQVELEPVRSAADRRSPSNRAQPASVEPVQSGEKGLGSSPETVDSLMEQISRNTARSSRRSLRIPEVPLIGEATSAGDPRKTAPDQPLLVPAEPVRTSDNRSSLFDLPDPATSPADPFSPETVDIPSSASSDALSDIASPLGGDAIESGVYDVISPSDLEPRRVQSDRPAASGGKHGLGRLFGRKKDEKDTMTSWLGVEDGFDAREFGRDVGSWDNFEGAEDDWKGGAAGDGDATDEELRAAITSMGDDELLGHDIWFVATGASEMGAAGMKAFLDAHRDRLRGVFLINLECVGAGGLAMVASEGEQRVLKGDKRIMNLVRKVSGALHREFATVEMPYITTDAHEAMAMSLRALTVAGVDGPRFALSHSEEDLPENVDPANIALAADVVTEVIRRS